MNVPFVDLRRQYNVIRDDVLAAAAMVFESTEYGLGKQVTAFEQEFGSYVDSPHCVGVNSGTSALHLALLAAGIQAGDEVITTPWTFVATVAAIVYIGAKPVFVDIDPVTYTIDPKKISAAITPKTKAIVPVHLYGHPAAMDEILAVARQNNILVIEDAAQAHGSEYLGRRCGSMGDAGCFSFYPGKNLGAYGEAGAVTTPHPEIARRVRMLRDWGAERKYEHVLKGYNYRLEAIQAAILRIKLRHLEQWTEARRAHAAAYRRLLCSAELVLPVEMPGCRHVYHLFAVRTPDRAALTNQLKAAGVQFGIHYPYPVHLLPAYSDLGYHSGDFPVAEQAAHEELSLPMFPEMTSVELETVVQAVSGNLSLAAAAVSHA